MYLRFASLLPSYHLLLINFITMTNTFFLCCELDSTGVYGEPIAALLETGDEVNLTRYLYNTLFSCCGCFFFLDVWSRMILNSNFNCLSLQSARITGCSNGFLYKIAHWKLCIFIYLLIIINFTYSFYILLTAPSLSPPLTILSQSSSPLSGWDLLRFSPTLAL